jgi:carbonic anhydrase/acetyltransferase-like protein (isoleucine patch superfamily)
MDMTPTLGERVYIDASAVVIGDVTLGDDVSFWPNAVARGDVHRIVVGARSNIQDGSVLHVTQDNQFNPGGFALSVGSDVTVGHGVILHGCTVEDNVLVGMGSLVLDGAVIQKRCMLAAGSLVSPGKILESGYLWMGRPAKKVRPLTEEELAYLDYAANHYVSLKNRYMSRGG